MTTSFTRTRTQIAQRVLGKVLKIGAITAASADADTVYEALDLRLKEIHKLGVFWRKVTSVPVSFSLTSSVATASAGAGDILFPISMSYVNGTGDDPIDLIGMDEYSKIANKTQGGNPKRALWKGGSEFILWPVPNANGTAKITYEKIADDTSAGAAVDVDVSMIRCLIDIVKYDVADDYGIEEQTINRWRAESAQAERDIRKLAVQHVDYATVAVDDYDSRIPTSKSDWNTG